MKSNEAIGICDGVEAKRVKCEKLKIFCFSKISEGWPSGLRRRSCPPEAGPPLAEKPVMVRVV